jgi:hypothetical protein
MDIPSVLWLADMLIIISTTLFRLLDRVVVNLVWT